MTHRILAVLLAAAMLAAPLAGQTRDGDAAAPPPTPWGDPDLQGVWNFSMNTPLERPAEFGARAVLTEEEAAQRAQADTQLRFEQDNRTPATEAEPTGGDVGGYNRFWTDLRRTAQVPMARSNGPVYEYACHEGNHSIVNILAGAR